MVKSTHRSFDGGAAGLIKRLEELASHKVAVGVPSDADSKGREKDSDVGNADLVYIHTHGVRMPPVRSEMQKEIDKGTKYSVALQMYIHSHGSAIYKVPPRPIIEPAIEKRKDEVAELLEKPIEAALNGEDYMKSLEDVGLHAKTIVQDYFEGDNKWPPNAESTIRRKGSDQPLIDTGALRQSITFVIDGGEKK